jgi:hypothetical protein
MAGLLEGALVMTLRCFAFALLERRRGASPLLFAHCLLLIAVYIARRGAAHRLASHRIVSCRIALRAVASAFAGRLHLRCVRFSLLLGARLGWAREMGEWGGGNAGNEVAMDGWMAVYVDGGGIDGVGVGGRETVCTIGVFGGWWGGMV